MIFLRGFLGLVSDLANCFLPVDIPEPLEHPWTDGT